MFYLIYQRYDANMEQIGLRLEVAQGPQSLARALIHGAGA